MHSLYWWQIRVLLAIMNECAFERNSFFENGVRYLISFYSLHSTPLMRTQLLLLVVLAIIGAQVLVCNAQSCEVVTTTLCEPMVPGMTTTPSYFLTLY